MDEFFRVRVATLKRMVEYLKKKKKVSIHVEVNAEEILNEIQLIVLKQQNEFDRIWKNIQLELGIQGISIKTERQLNAEQKRFVHDYFDEKVRNHIIPLMIESLPGMPYIRDKSIYLGVVMKKQQSAYEDQYAIIEVPVKYVGRFILLPTSKDKANIILLEDIIRQNLPRIFPYFNFDSFEAWIFKVTKDAEIELENDVNVSFVERMEKGIKSRRKGKPVRFVYDKEMDNGLLQYLIQRLGLTKKSGIIPGGRIHNFRHFMDFPKIVPSVNGPLRPIIHPLLKGKPRVTEVILRKDVMLHFPYHSFNSLLDLLREAAMDPQVQTIQLTAYRLAQESMVINALINASRNNKKVIVMLELKARFEEEANLDWKNRLEEEGIQVLLGVPNYKVHCKLCVISRKEQKGVVKYGFISTGNLNESTAKLYADHCLLTADKGIMNDVEKIFTYLASWTKGFSPLRKCKTLIVAPVGMRNYFIQLIQREITAAKAGKPAGIILKMNSLSDPKFIRLLKLAVKEGVDVKLIVRGIYCAPLPTSKKHITVKGISIIDEFLEHARVFSFLNNGNQRVFISSADWMVRNLDHRIEAAVEIKSNKIKSELLKIVSIQLHDNVKARILDEKLQNQYVTKSKGKQNCRSQHAIYSFLKKNIS
jgi:polyphosphate kinase